MADNEGEATITKKGSFGYNNEKEQYVIKASTLAGIFEPGVSPEQAIRDAIRQKSGQDESYDTYSVSRSTKKEGIFGLITNDVILIKTSDRDVKQFVAENFGAKFDLKIEQMVMVDGKAVPAREVSIPGGFEVSEVDGKSPTRDSIMDKIQSLEGGSKYRMGSDMAFTIEEKAGRFFVVPAQTDAGRDLQNALKNQNVAALAVSPPVIAQLEPKKRGERAVA